jgi:hypothetical protein
MRSAGRAVSPLSSAIAHLDGITVEACKDAVQAEHVAALTSESHRSRLRPCGCYWAQARKLPDVR